MRRLGISNRGMLRLAAQFELDDAPEVEESAPQQYAPQQYGPQPVADATTGYDPQAIQETVEALSGWIDYFKDSKDITDEQIQDIQNQIEFLNSYVYETPAGAEDTSELTRRLDLLEQQIYEGPGQAAAEPALMAPQRKTKPKKKKPLDPYALPDDRSPRGWWDIF